MGETRRLLLEVFKWLQPKELLLTATRVSQTWKTVGEMDELWREFTGTEGEQQGRLMDVFRFDVYHPTYMPIIIENTLNRVSLSTWEMQPILSSPDLSFLPGMRLLFLHNNDLLMCGGWKSLKCTVIPSRAPSLCPFADLPIEKSYHGLVEVGDTVYSFGGYTDGNPTSDTFSISVHGDNWTTKSAMIVPRCEISPSVHRLEVYIPGGFDTSIEKYSPQTDSFELLSYTIPQETSATAIAFNLLLILLTPKERLITAISTGEQVSLCSLELWWAGHSDQSPFIYNGRCYMSVHSGGTAKVYAYGLRDNRFGRREIGK